MATPATTTKAYLLKNGDACIQFVGNPPTNISGRVPIYTANLDSFTCFPDETYDAQQIKLVSEAIKNASELGDNKPIIEMYGKYDTFYEKPRIYTQVSFPHEFLNTLSGILPDATISIIGTYKAVRKTRAGYYARLNPPRAPPIGSVLPYWPFEFYQGVPVPVAPYDPADEMGQNMVRVEYVRVERPGLDPLYVPSYHASDEILWTPVDDLEHEFSVKGLQPKENVTYLSFNGKEKLGEYFKLGGVTYAKLKYSVVIEWKEFQEPNEAFEASILETLFEDKPLADCVLESSNKKEFECHQNILGANSEVLLRMLENGKQESQTKRIEMKDMSGESVKMMLDYMYGRELKLDGLTEEEILELLKAAHKYEISRLELIISRFLLYKPMEWFTMDGVLAFYFYAKNVDSLVNLTEKLKVVMKANAQELSVSAAYKEWMAMDAKAASEFVKQLLKPEQGNANVAVGMGERNAEHRVIDVVEDDVDE